MKLAMITDEITQDFDTSVAFALEHGLDALELRTINDTPIHLIDNQTLYAWKKILDNVHLSVCCLSGSFYKCVCNCDNLEQELSKLDRLCQQADILNCSFIRGFAFFSQNCEVTSPIELQKHFKKPIQILQKYNKILLLEADPSVNTPTHRSLALLLQEINHPLVRAIFDPGNSLYAQQYEQPFPTAYQAIKPYFCHIHIKDTIRATPESYCVKVGDGEVNYPELLQVLKQDGYSGFLSMETHYRHNTTLSEDQMRIPGGIAFSDGGTLAMAESIASLRLMLEKV